MPWSTPRRVPIWTWLLAHLRAEADDFVWRLLKAGFLLLLGALMG